MIACGGRKSAGQLLFHLISKLHENTSLLITTHLAFAYPLGISIRVLEDEAGHPRWIADEEAKAYRAAAIVHVEHI
jgi:hypothetical protein